MQMWPCADRSTTRSPGPTCSDGSTDSTGFSCCSTEKRRSLQWWARSSSCSATHATGDVLAFAFSGHGTYVVDRTGDGDERYDEAMVTHDDLLTDDEFAGLLDGLNSGARLTVISDSCFAAGVLDIEEEDTKPRGGDRAKGFRPKGFRPKGFRPKGFRPKYLPPDVFEREAYAPPPPDKPYPRRRIEERGMRELLLAAAGPGRIAFDDDFDGAPQGVLTHYALQAMNEARYVPHVRAAPAAAVALIPPAFDQVPLLEGAGKGRTVFT